MSARTACKYRHYVFVACNLIVLRTAVVAQLSLTLVLYISLTDNVCAQATDFVIDPTQSYLTLDSTITYPSNVPLQEQFPGSLNTTLSGDVFADLTSAGTITFSPATAIDFTSQPLLAQPGGTSAQYAGQLTNYPSAGTTSYVAYRNLQLTATNSLSLAGNDFAASQLNLNFQPGSASNIQAPGLFVGNLNVEALTTNASGTGMLAPSGAGERIVIPLDFTGTSFEQSLHFTGQLVAVSAGPPPPIPGVQVVKMAATDLAYSRQDGMIYASTPANASHAGGTLTQINPLTATTGTAFDMTGSPTRIVASDDGSYIHAVTNGNTVVQRFNVAQGVVDLKTPMGADGSIPRQVSTISAVPGQPDSVLLSLRSATSSPPALGTWIYKDGVPLPDSIGTGLGVGGPDITTIDPSGHFVYGYVNSNTGYDFWIDKVTASGLEPYQFYPGGTMISGPNIGRIEVADGKLFTNAGTIVDLATTHQIGTFLGGGNFTIDEALHRLFSVTDSPQGWTVSAYDTNTLSLLGTKFIPGFFGHSSSLIRWGTDGLAFHDDQGQVIIVETSLVPEPSPFALAVVGSLVLLVSSRCGRSQYMHG